MATARNRRNGAKRAIARAAACVACALALVAAGLCLGSCAPHDDRVHLLVKVPRTGHSVVFDEGITQIDQVISILADRFEQDYGKVPVHLDVEVFEQNQYDDAIAGSFGTEKSPDVLYGDYFNMSTFIHSGRVVPLDDVASGDVRDGVFEYLWDMSTVDGKVYMLPYLARQNVLAYNKQMLRDAGLGEYVDAGEGRITSWSLEEWTQILDALAASLPEHSFPMMMYAGSSQGDTHIMTLLRSAGSDFFDEDGHFNLSEPEGVAALRWIQQGVERGWFPPHSENLEIEDCSSLFRNEQLGIYMVNNASIGRYGDKVGLVNFPGPDDDGCATTFISGFEVFDNGDPQKVQIAKDFLEYVYTSDELMGYAAGTLPASKAVAEQYGDSIDSFELFRDNQDNVVDFTGHNPDTLAVREVFHTCIHDLLMGTLTPEQAAARIDELCNEAIDAGIATSQLHE